MKLDEQNSIKYFDDVKQLVAFEQNTTTMKEITIK
jgi:hypothetical protein